MNLRILLALCFFVTISNGYKILVIAPFYGKSHWLYMSSFVKTLLGRGHEVTYLTSISLKNLNLTNYSEVLIDPPLDMSTKMSQDELVKRGSKSVFSYILEMAFFPTYFNGHNLDSINVRKFINSTDLRYDLVLMEDFFSDSFLMFAHKFKAPIVTVSPFGPTDSIDREMGLLTPWSFVPHWTSTMSDKMSFSERWFNSVVGAWDWIVRKYLYMPNQQAVAEQYFGHLGPLPSVTELRRNISLVLINTHRSLSPPRPMMPNEINIGGAHIKPAKPLPADLQTFLDESKHGVIYFSLGTVVQSSKMPKETDAFKNLKQRVLWKFEDESLSDVPPNVMIRKWMPQNDILAHQNVVLFISHGGLFGTSESLYYGRPMLLIPFFGDQFRNAHRIKSVGYGDYIFFNEITKDTILKAVTELISDESYSTKAKEISAIYNSNLVHPMEEAMWWIEYVCKFKGAKHLKSNAVNMSWFSYLLLDVLAVNVVGFIAVLYIIFKLFKIIIGRKAPVAENSKKRN